MRRNFLFLALLTFVFAGLHSTAQILSKPINKNVLRCYTVERMNEFRRIHPNAETDAQFEAWLSQRIKARRQSGQRPLADYVIPVVFHIIHNGEAQGTPSNVDAALIQEQLLQLNKDFANQSNSPYPVAAATGIQFVLAQNDPTANALAEPGVDRIDRNDRGWDDYSGGWEVSYIDGTVKPASIWDPSRYFNVWVVPALSGLSNDILGYATLPSSSTLQGLNNNENANTAGVVILSQTVGSTFLPNNCNNGYGKGKTLTHESGHFFGLRHIWGDTNCGNDFCDDTPVHFTANQGVPSHPKPNSCGSPDEMFENFMDYSDDIILNTFTADQVERMQTVMINSPRRVSLATSNVGGVIPAGSNQISFINCNGLFSSKESGTNATYPRYKDVSFTLNVEDKATGPATVSINVAGTAVSGLHYELLTPSVVFAAGDNYKPVNIRVFDNARIDGDRTIILSYTISGTGVSAGSDAQSVTFNLLDDDNMRVGENVINLLDEHFETGVGIRSLPAGWGLLTSGGYVNQFVASANGDAGGSGRAAHITNNIETKPNTYTKGVPGVAVLQSPVIDASSVESLGNLSFTYKTRGLEVYDEASLVYTPSDAPTGPFYYYGSNGGEQGFGPYSSNTAVIGNFVEIAPPDNLESRQFNIDFFWQTDTLTTGSDPGFNVDDVVLTATPYHVETSVSNSYAYDVQSGAEVHNYKSTNNRAIASIVNASANINEVTARITAAGPGTVPVTTNGGSFLRTQKVFQISPAAGNATVTYQATLYFTTEELAIWGADRLNLKILKVSDGVLLTSTLNLNNAELITPTVFQDTAAGYITYTGNFTGFSQFVLVSPLTSLPVTITKFEATALQRNIRLDWSTAQEINNKGYIVERGTDGINFTQVGWVNGNGTTAVASNYTFTDNLVQPGIVYYYRLRQVDLDNRQVYSQVRNARVKPGAEISISISPNPVKDQVTLFISGTANRATLELVNPLGQKLLRKTGVNAVDGGYKLQLPGLAAGVYTMIIYLPEGSFTKKIVVQ